MALLEQLDRDLVSARKDRDETRLSTLGLLKSEVVRATKAKGSDGVADDEMVLRVIRTEVKRREEASQAYAAAGRAESARREDAEAEVLRAYLPAEMGDDELEREVRAVIDEVRPQGPRDFSTVMRVARARLADRADGGRIASLARRLLA
jgi:uncharacterized protein YqeY